MGSKLVEGVLEAATAVAGVARHLAWYVRYQLDAGDTARADDLPRGRRTHSSRDATRGGG